MKVKINGHMSEQKDLIYEILRAIYSVEGYGSIEIYIQDNHVTQITTRNIKKLKKPVEKIR